MERAHLIRLKRTYNGMQHATIMEQDEVLFLPVVRIHQLGAAEVIIEEGDGNKANTHTRRDSRSLHLVQQITNLLEVRDICAIGVERAFARGALRKWTDEQLMRSAGMHLEMERASHRVLPRLRGS